ncbi:hypothetical protein [uncultured Pseudoteredinibacter sp.]|uniref:hypothetical protein n=1 Tax=uncultured Pseudoteredinibacter sp. TaxID=1641701 RepID=UPI00261A068F|nr:hypothetical protein [uncultured Pseudoteredinibacter sp.]
MIAALKRQVSLWLFTLVSIAVLCFVGVALSQWFLLNSLAVSVSPWSRLSIIIRYTIYVFLVLLSPWFLTIAKTIKYDTSKNSKNYGHQKAKGLRFRKNIRLKMVVLVIAYEAVVIANPIGIIMEQLYGR